MAINHKGCVSYLVIESAAIFFSLTIISQSGVTMVFNLLMHVIFLEISKTISKFIKSSMYSGNECMTDTDYKCTDKLSNMGMQSNTKFAVPLSNGEFTLYSNLLKWCLAQ